MSQLLLPIGQPLGVFSEETETAESAGGAVRVADDFLDLTRVQYRIWLLCFVHTSRDQLVAAARQAGLGLTAEATHLEIDGLVKQGVLLEVLPGEDIAELLSAYCLLPTGFGLGASSTRPGYFEIGGPDFKSRAQVEFAVYLVWAAASRSNMWQTCQMLAQEHDIDPQTLGEHVLANLPVLTGSGSAFLDEAV